MFEHVADECVEATHEWADWVVVFERVWEHVFVEVKFRHAGTKFAQVADHNVFRDARQMVDVLVAGALLKDLEDAFERCFAKNGRVVLLVPLVGDGGEVAGAGHHVGQ